MRHVDVIVWDEEALLKGGGIYSSDSEQQSPRCVPRSQHRPVPAWRVEVFNTNAINNASVTFALLS